MKQFVFRALFAVLPLFFGTLLQIVHLWPVVDRLENLFWGSIYGLGWFVIGFFVDLRQRGPALFGFIVWPLIVSAVLYWLAGKLWRSNDRRLTGACAALLAISLCLDVTISMASKPPLGYLPLWYNQMFNIY